MKQIRLLPVVIVAASALFVLKGLGIMTHGGYVLVGSGPAAAAGGKAEEPTIPLTPPEPTLTDASPVLTDTAPTLPLGPAVDAAAAHGAEATEQQTAESPTTDHAAGTEAAAPATATAEATPAEPAAAVDVARNETCPPIADAPATEEGAEDGLDFINGPADCVLDEHGDAVPTIKDGAGNISQLAPENGSASEAALLERLAERRDALDAREAELEMRLALVEAAEKRIAERTAVLEALEARIDAMVDEKRMLEESQFVALVAMYETMKPKDAAAIFDELEMPVLLRVARAINPRKMAPIMARMNPTVAKELTAGLAVDQVEPTIELGQEDLAALPQIIGQ